MYGLRFAMCVLAPPARRKRILYITLSCLLIITLFYLLNINPVPRNPETSSWASLLRIETLSSHSTNTDTSRNANLDMTESPNLKPPTQQWAHDQLNKAMSFLGWTYTPPNRWEECTPRTYFFPQINTVFTGVPKTGSSNWLIALLGAEGELKKNVNPQKVAWVHGGASNRHRVRGNLENFDYSALQGAFSFAVVRNPWTRLVSGYRQKISSEVTQGGTYMRGLGMRIVSERRGITDPEVLKDLYPTFEEFAWHLIRVDREKRSFDRHFVVQTRELCIPHAMYDFLVPLEYSSTLSEAVWNKINGTSTSLLTSYDKTTDPRLQSSTLKAKKWLSELDPKMAEDLYRIFKGDFLMMNYSNFSHPDFPLPLHSRM